jgi:hypothetical protein
MKVFIFKNRGVVVSDPVGFALLRPDLIVRNYEDCYDIHIRDCRLRMNGDDGFTWASRWISGKAGDRLTTIPCKTCKIESGFKMKEIVKSFIKTTGRRHKEKGGASQRHIGETF